MFRYLILLILISCNSGKVINDSPKFEMEVNLNKIEDEFYKCNAVEVIFNIDVTERKFQNLIFNVYDLSYECNSFENTSLGVFSEKKSIYSLENSHFIIENSSNEFKIFDEFVNYNKRDVVEDCTYRNLNDIVINKSSDDKKIKTSTIVCKDDLAIRKYDEKIRIWYYYKNKDSSLPDKQKFVLLSSNWIEI